MIFRCYPYVCLFWQIFGKKFISTRELWFFKIICLIQSTLEFSTWTKNILKFLRRKQNFLFLIYLWFSKSEKFTESCWIFSNYNLKKNERNPTNITIPRLSILHTSSNDNFITFKYHTFFINFIFLFLLFSGVCSNFHPWSRENIYNLFR